MVLSIVALVASGISALFTGWYVTVARSEGSRQASLDLLDRLDRTRSDRYRIREAKLEAPVDWSRADPDLLPSFDQVARSFDVAGAFDRLGMVPQRFTDCFFANTFHDLWVNFGLRDYVDWVRASRGPMHYWELVQFYERVKFVSENHPAETGTSSWPRHPRKSRRGRSTGQTLEPAAPAQTR